MIFGHRAAGYVAALAAIALALSLKLAAGDALGASTPFLGFPFAIILAAWLGGLGPGLLATALAAALAPIVFFDPSSLGPQSVGVISLRLGIIVLQGVAISLMAHYLRRARAEAIERSRISRDAERKTAQILESIGESFFALDRDWRFTYFNAESERYFGRTRQEVLGRRFLEVFPALAGSEFERQYQRAVEEQATVEFEASSVLSPGRFIELRAYPSPEGLSVYFRDITSRRKTEETLKLHSRVLENMTEGVSVADENGTIVYTNPAEDRMFGYGPGELIGRHVTEQNAYASEENERVVAEVMRRLKDHGEWAGEWLNRRKDGTTFYTSSRISSVERDGRQHWVCVQHDITERKQAERALRESEQRFRHLADAMPQIVWSTDAEGKVDYLNHQTMQYTGLPVEQLLESIWVTVLHPDDREEAYQSWLRAVATGEPFENEHRFLRFDGEYRWQLARGVPVRDESGTIVRWFGTCTDVHDRKLAEEALRRTTDRVAQLQRLTAALSVSRTPAQVAEVVVEQGFAALGANAGSVSLLAEDGEHLEIIRTNGYPPDVMETWKRYSLDAPIALAAAARDREPVFLENPEDRLRRFPALSAVQGSGGTQSSASLPMLVEDRLVGVVAFSFTEPRKFNPEDREFLMALVRQCAQAMDRARLFEAEQQARAAAERANAAKDQFLAALSHELRTPLNPVLMSVSAMQHEPNLPPAVREDLEMIRRNVELEARLIDDLLDLTRIARGKLELSFATVDVHEKVRHVTAICRSELQAKSQQLVLELSADRPLVQADPARLQQVLWNLIKNAVKFTPVGGLITVRTDGHDGRLSVSVRDNGVGIDPELLPRIFEAFEQGGTSVTRQFGGLGLGLTISKALVDLHGGTLQARSDGKGRGAEFVLTLPTSAASHPRPPAVVAPQAQDPSTRATRVLLVEDHADTLRVMQRLLSRRGYAVETANTLGGALQSARSREFDLLISDIGLPDGNGLEIMRQLRDGGRSVPGIALSGFGMEEDVRRSKEAGFAEHLTKPVDLRKLEDALERLVRPFASPVSEGRSPLNAS